MEIFVKEKLPMELNILGDIGDRFREIRKTKNLTQQEVAKLLGISQGFYAGIENGRKKPEIKILISIRNIFQVNLHFLLTGEGSMYCNEEKGKESEIEIYNNMEKEYIKKLLRILRTKQDTTVMAIKQNIEAFLTTPDKTVELPKKKIAV